MHHGNMTLSIHGSR